MTDHPTEAKAEQMPDLNIYMLLDGMRTAEAYEREITERLCDADRQDIGPGERYALIDMKLAAHACARKFIAEIARRAEALP